jgi:hypothetical protein
MRTFLERQSLQLIFAIALPALAACGTDDETGIQPGSPSVDDSASTRPDGAQPTPVEVGRFEGGYNAATGEFYFRTLPRELPDNVGVDGLRGAGQASVASGSWCEANTISDGTSGSNPTDSFEIYSVDSSVSFNFGACQALVASALAGGDIPARLGFDSTDFFGGVFCFDTVVTNFYDTETWPGVIAEITLFDGATSEQPYRYPIGTTAPTVADDTVDETIATWYYGELSPGESQHVPWAFKFGGNDFAFEGRLIAQVYENCGNAIDDDCDGDVDGVDVDCHFGPYVCAVDADCATNNCVAGTCASDCRDGYFGPTCTWPCMSGIGCGNGTCDDGLAGTGTCDCNPGSSGELCTTCDEGYYGGSCTACPGGGGIAQCSGHGTCNDGNSGTGVCTCTGNFAGASCNDCATNYGGASCLACPGGVGNCCSGNGTFNGGIAGGTCTCSGGYTGADCSVAPTLTVPTGVDASFATRTDGVQITWNAAAGATSYIVYGDGVEIGTTTSTTFVDYGAPLGSVVPGTASASDATRRRHVILSISGASVVPATARSYTVAASNGVSTTAQSGADVGQRAVGALSAQWQRTASDDGTDAFVNIDGGIGVTYDDTLAPADASARFYRALVLAPGATPAYSTTDRGMRATSEVAATANFSCRVTENGQLNCWGGATTSGATFAPLGASVGVIDLAADVYSGYMYGVLADGRAFFTPGALSPGSQLSTPANDNRRISAANANPCVVRANGTVLCGNAYNVALTPVANLSNAVDITQGFLHACALRADSTVACFGTPYGVSAGGSATYGQMGDGTTTVRNMTVTSPVRTSAGDAAALSNVVQLSSWELGSCALLANGTARCWGFDPGWGVGGGTLNPQSPSPVLLPNPFPGTTFQQITSSLIGLCVVLSDSTAACSGIIGSAYGSLTRVRLAGNPADMTQVQTIAGGYPNLVMLDWGGQAFTAGNNFSRNPQNFFPNNGAQIPAQPLRTHQVVSGGSYTCSLDDVGSVRCWGQGGYLGRGDLTAIGDDEVASGNARVITLGGTARELVAVGSSRMCAIMTDATVRCFNTGSDGTSLIGDNEAPGSAARFAAPAGRQVAALATGTSLTETNGDLMMITDNGAIYDGTTLVTSPAGRTAVDLASNTSTHCAILDDQTVRCWGESDAEGGSGSLAYASPDLSPTVRPSAGVGAIDIVVGDDASAVIGTDLSIYTWGDNVAGNLGVGGGSLVLGDDEVIDGTLVSAARTLDGGIYSVLSVGGGNYFCSASGARTVCWGGNNSDGRLGTGTVYSVGAIPGADTVFDEASFANFFTYASGDVRAVSDSPFGTTCALYADWRVQCWGRNSQGQLGYGNTTGPIGDNESPLASGSIRGW